MPGLLGTLDLGARSLQTQQQGVQVAGHNIANVNNPAYARQRLQIQTAPTTDTALGAQGNGAMGVAIVRLRSQGLDRQIQAETSITGYLEARQTALQYVEANLGQEIDTRAAAGTSATGSQHSLAAGLTDLFNAFQGLANDPAAPAQREVLVLKAAEVASRFNQVDTRLAGLNAQLNTAVEADTAAANELLAQIASLNQQIARAQSDASAPNDLLDLRQEKIETLAKLVKVSVGAGDNGMVDISIGGTTLVAGREVVDSLETYDSGGGQLLVRTRNGGAALSPTGGSIAGTIDARDGELASLRGNLNTLVAALIAEVNTTHRAGFNLEGGTGADFFTGTGAGDIAVNAALLDDPGLVQAGGTAGAAGDNAVALKLAGLAEQPIASLNQQTFAQHYGQTIAALGQALASVNQNVEDQTRVQALLANQRASISGVSLDEEMTDLTKYQKAFEASARLIAIVDQLLETLLNAKA